MKIKVKKLHHNAVIPHYAKEGDAGLDLTATSMWEEDELVCYGTGLAFEIPKGYVGLLFPRSSCSNTSLIMANCVGVIDSGYRGEVTIKCRKVYDNEGNGLHHLGFKEYMVGDRVAQLIVMPYPQVELEEAEELSETERGTGGYGSSGR